MSTDLPFPKTSEGLSAHLDGELSPEETAAVEEWLRSSSEARQTLAKLRLIEQELKSFARDARQATPSLPAGWSDAVVARIAAAQAAASDTDASSPVRPAFDLDDLPLSNAPQGDAFWRRAQFWQFAGACSAAAAILFALYAPAIAPGDAASANVALAEPSPEDKLNSAFKNLAGNAPMSGWAGAASVEVHHGAVPSAAEGAPVAAGAPVGVVVPAGAGGRRLEEQRKGLQANGVERKNVPGRSDHLKKAAQLGDRPSADEASGDGEGSAGPYNFRGGEGNFRGGAGMNRAADPKQAEKLVEMDDESVEQRRRQGQDAAPASRPLDAMRQAGAGGGKGEGGGAPTGLESSRFGGAVERSEKSDAKEKQMQAASAPAPQGGVGGAGGGGFRAPEVVPAAKGPGGDGGPPRRGGAEPAVKLYDGAPTAAPADSDRAAAPRTGGPAAASQAPPRPAALNQLEAEKVGGAAPAPAPAATMVPPAATVPSGEAGDPASALRRRTLPAPGEAFKGSEAFQAAGAGKPQPGVRGGPQPRGKEAGAPDPAPSSAPSAPPAPSAALSPDAKREVDRKQPSPAKPAADAEPAAAMFAQPAGVSNAAAAAAPVSRAPVPSAPVAAGSSAPKPFQQEAAKSGADKDASRDAQRAAALGAPAPPPMVARSLPKERGSASLPAPGAMAAPGAMGAPGGVGAAGANGAPSAAAEVARQAVVEPKLWIVSLEMSLPAVQSAALDQVLGEHKIPWQATDVAELSSDLTASTFNYQTNADGAARLGVDARGAAGRGPTEAAKTKPSNGEDSGPVVGKTAANAPADRPQAPPAVEAIWMEAPREVVEEMVERMRSKPEAFPKVAVRVWRSADARTASAPSSDVTGRLPKAQAEAALPADADLRLAAVSEGLRRAVGQGRTPQQPQSYGFAQRMRVSSELEARLLARTDDAPVQLRKLLEDERLAGDKAKPEAQAFGAPAGTEGGEEALAARFKSEATSFDRSAPLRVLILVRAAAVR